MNAESEAVLAALARLVSTNASKPLTALETAYHLGRLDGLMAMADVGVQQAGEVKALIAKAAA